jgi:hypothetical protein
MNISDKMRGWVLSITAALVVAGSLISTSHDPRERTVILERVAAKVDRAREIAPETQRAIADFVASVDRIEAGVDEQLRGRRKIALEQIDGALLRRMAAIR